MRDLNEYAGAIAVIHALSDYLRAARSTVAIVFKEFDSSRDGTLDESELKSALLDQLQLPDIGEREVASLINFLDEGGDGEIDMGELSKAIKLYHRKKKNGELKDWRGAAGDRLDEVFPDWLVTRRDFRIFFPRLREAHQARAAASGKGHHRFTHEELVLVALRTQEDRRTREDLTKITDWLQKIHLFKRLPFDALLEVAGKVSMSTHRHGDVLFREGQEGEALYVVLSGKVNISRMMGNEDIVIADLGPDRAFGEQTLVVDNTTHNASAIVAETSRIVALKSRTYNAILKRFETRLVTEKSKFLQDTMPLTRDWPFSKAHALAPLLRADSYEEHNEICHEGGAATELYLLRSGTAVLYTYLNYDAGHHVPIRGGKRDSRFLSAPHRHLHVLERIEGPAFFGEGVLLSEQERFHPYYVKITSRNADVYTMPGDVARRFFTRLECAGVREACAGRRRSNADLLAAYTTELKQKFLYNQLKLAALGPEYGRRLAEEKERLRRGRSQRKLKLDQAKAKTMPVVQSLPALGMATLKSKAAAKARKRRFRERQAGERNAQRKGGKVKLKPMAETAPLLGQEATLDRLVRGADIGVEVRSARSRGPLESPKPEPKPQPQPEPKPGPKPKPFPVSMPNPVPPDTTTTTTTTAQVSTMAVRALKEAALTSVASAPELHETG
mmetsp:Transcript_22756/g.70463  ORF Transcript_22756/g.70463 Transcript_22756/m.70463 type:complete len:673 (-) Transcript_22756:374-2392(-)